MDLAKFMLALNPPMQLELFDVSTLGVTDTSHLALMDRTNQLIQNVNNLFIDEVQLKLDFTGVFSMYKDLNAIWHKKYLNDRFDTVSYVGTGDRVQIIRDTVRQVNGVELNAVNWVANEPGHGIYLNPGVYHNPAREIDLTTIRPAEAPIVGVGDYVVRNDFAAVRDLYVIPPRNMEHIELRHTLNPTDWTRYVTDYETANPITTPMYNVDGEEE